MNAPARRPPVNLGALIGVLFGFLLLVTAWVVIDSGGDDSLEIASTTGPDQSLSPTVPSTSPVLLPTTAPDAAPTLPPTVAPTQPVTAAPTATQPTTTTTEPTTTTTTQPTTTTTTQPTTTTTTITTVDDSGDLGIDGHPISTPECTGAFITIVASSIGDGATSESVGALLDEHDDAEYLRTDQTCPSLTQQVDGEPIYVVYLGPFANAAAACDAREAGRADAYVRRLSDDLGPDHTVECDGSSN